MSAPGTLLWHVRAFAKAQRAAMDEAEPVETDASGQPIYPWSQNSAASTDPFGSLPTPRGPAPPGFMDPEERVPHGFDLMAAHADFIRRNRPHTRRFVRRAALVRVLAQHRVKVRLGARTQSARRPMHRPIRIRLRPRTMTAPQQPLAARAARRISRPTGRSGSIRMRPFARAGRRQSSATQTRRFGGASQKKKIRAGLLRRVQPLQVHSLQRAQRRLLRSTERHHGPPPQSNQRRAEEPLQCPWQKRFMILNKR